MVKAAGEPDDDDDEGTAAASPLRFPLIVLAVLGGLAVLGTSTGVLGPAGVKRVVALFSAPPPPYVTLPEMSIDLGGGGGGAARSLDVRVSVKFDTPVDPTDALLYAPRIADRLGDRVRDIGLDRLNGAQGATLLKEALSYAIEREMSPVRPREIMLEQMTLR